MLRAVFDSSALITCCQAATSGKPVIEHVLAVCTVTIPIAVRNEVLVMSHQYADARLASDLITAESIRVEKVALPPGNILDHYKLGAGEKEAVALYLDKSDQFGFLVTDDRLDYVVSNRCAIPTSLFLDLLIEMVERGLMAVDLAQEIAEAVQLRYAAGFVHHTLKMIERGDRKCLA